MVTHPKDLLEPIRYDETSLDDLGEATTLKECRLGQYTVVVRLACDGRFAGIEEIRVNSDFFSLEQRMSVPSLDVEKYYRDDDGE